MINGINTSINSSIVNKDLLQKQQANNQTKEVEQVEVSKAEQIKEQIAKGEYKINLQASAEKMASNLL